MFVVQITFSQERQKWDFFFHKKILYETCNIVQPDSFKSNILQLIIFYMNSFILRNYIGKKRGSSRHDYHVPGDSLFHI